MLTDIDYAETSALLDKCGIEYEDLKSSMQCVIHLVGDTAYTDWLQRLQIERDTMSLEEFSAQYPADCARALHVLTTHR